MSETATVTFIDPCLNPFTFSSNTQTNPDEDKFSGNDIVFTLNQFTITPTICDITYVCTKVEKLGVSEISLIDCSDFAFDGVINGQVSDGKLIFSANSADYLNGNVTPGN